MNMYDFDKTYPRITWTEENRLKFDNTGTFLEINTKTKCDYIPEIIDITEEISGVDGEMHIKSKFLPRLFNIYAQTNYKMNYINEQLNFIKNEIGIFMLKAKNDYIELYIEKMRAIILVKLSGIIELPEQYPNWVEFHFPFISYDDVYFHESSWRRFRGSSNIVNNGELELYPFFEFTGYLNNPTIIINGQLHRYNGVIADGQKVIVDNENQKVYMKNPNGTITNLTDNWNGVFSSIPTGTTNINIDQNTGAKCSVIWRPRWITFRK